MTFDSVNIISFNDENRKTYPVRDIKPIGQFQSGMLVDVPRGSFLDEISSRREFYGDGSEDLSYQIFEHNIVKIVEARFDFAGVKRLDIPIVNEE